MKIKDLIRPEVLNLKTICPSHQSTGQSQIECK